MPEGTTHASNVYGVIHYYKKVSGTRLNHVSEEKQNVVSWFYFNRGFWEPVETGFCSRRLTPILGGEAC